MLQITDDAVQVIRKVWAENEIPEGAALRIDVMQDQDQEGIGFEFVDGPQEGDQPVAEETQLSIYVAGGLAAPLSGAVLDTVETDQGPAFELRDRDHEAHEGHQHEGHDHEGHEHHRH
jgi:Fe-S cluster assembly iron-binding protein IscA